jgi:hypothetical protein
MEHMEQKIQDLTEGYEHEFNELCEENNPPSDWSNPKWEIEDRVHNWRNYASEAMIREWGDFTGRQKIIISGSLDRIADREEWD